MAQRTNHLWALLDTVYVLLVRYTSVYVFISPSKCSIPIRTCLFEVVNSPHFGLEIGTIRSLFSSKEVNQPVFRLAFVGLARKAADISDCYSGVLVAGCLVGNQPYTQVIYPFTVSCITRIQSELPPRYGGSSRSNISHRDSKPLLPIRRLTHRNSVTQKASSLKIEY